MSHPHVVEALEERRLLASTAPEPYVEKIFTSERTGQTPHPGAAVTLSDGRVVVSLLDLHFVSRDGSAISPVPGDPHERPFGSLYPDPLTGGFYASDGVGLFRFDASGQLMPSFGTGGRKTFSGFDIGFSTFYPTRKGLYVATHRWGSLAVRRLKADGSVDKTFGQGGQVALPSPKVLATHGEVSHQPKGLWVLPGGRIVVAHYARPHQDPDRSLRYAVVDRLKPDGSPDRSFAKKGRLTFRLAPEEVFGQAIRDRGNGMLLSFSKYGTRLLRFDADGTRDKSYGGDGTAWLPQSFGQISLTPDGGILGGTGNGGVVRFAADGQEAGVHRALAQRTTGVAQLHDGGAILTRSIAQPYEPYWSEVYRIGGTFRSTSRWLTVDRQIGFEDFDYGGEGVAYHEVDPTPGRTPHRDAGVDVEPSADDGGGGWHVAGTRPGEWIEYTLDVETAGQYRLDLRLAGTSATAGGRFRVEVDGVDVSGSVSVPRGEDFQTISIAGVPLVAGSRRVRVVMEAAGADGVVGKFNWFRFIADAAD